MTFDVIKLFLLTSILIISGSEADTTVETIKIETTTELIEIQTDIPQSDVEIALNLDYGRYTTVKFNYYNKQFYEPNYWNLTEEDKSEDRCFDDYLKCIVAIAVPEPVCAYNDPYDVPDGYITHNSYCDLYFDNCQRNMRFWRIVSNGKCNFTWKKYRYFNVIPTRKFKATFKDFFRKNIIKLLLGN